MPREIEQTPAPILDFGLYAAAITKIIQKSYPKFCIGIYGEWGIGKTTLMKSIFTKLKAEGKGYVVPVWFNAWRCEREDYFALIPLLKTIELSLPRKYRNLRSAFKEV